MNSEYLFFYSNFDTNSKELMDKLYKNHDLYQKFHLININNKKLRSLIPRSITEIPAFLITENGQRFPPLFGAKALEWIKERSIQASGESELSSWDPSGMTGFSDNFSSLDDNEGEMKKNYSYLGGQTESIYTPDAQPISGQGNGGGQQQQMQQPNFSMQQQSRPAKSSADAAYERLINQRNQELPKPISGQRM